MIYNLTTGNIHCSKCNGKCISKARKMLNEKGTAAIEFIEMDDYEMYICKKCGYSDYIGEEVEGEGE